MSSRSCFIGHGQVFRSDLMANDRATVVRGQGVAFEYRCYNSASWYSFIILVWRALLVDGLVAKNMGRVGVIVG